jgi:hypothetical protein
LKGFNLSYPTLREHIERETQERRAENQQAARSIEEMVVGGLHLEIVGLSWLVLGVVGTSIPDEIAAESLHWMDWYHVLSAIRAILMPSGRLAVLDRRLGTVPWWRALQPLIPLYSTNRDFQAYDLLEERARRQLLHPAGPATTTPVLFNRSVDDYIASWHSHNGFSWDRMSASSRYCSARPTAHAR